MSLIKTVVEQLTGQEINTLTDKIMLDRIIGLVFERYENRIKGLKKNIETLEVENIKLKEEINKLENRLELEYKKFPRKKAKRPKKKK